MPGRARSGTHRGVNKTSRRGPRSDERRWTLDEATILYAASPPPDQQDYDKDRPWVRDLADLLSRTPSSISMHLGNFAHAADSSRGLKNAGAVFTQVVDRYKNDHAGLIAEAKRLRRKYFESDTSPRVEIELTDADDARLKEELVRRFPEARLPPGSIIVYQYDGSLCRGVLVLLETAILYPQETADLFRIAIAVLGASVRRNQAANSALDGRTLELAEREIASLAPKLDYNELDPKDRVSMALLLPKLKSLRHWRPQAKRLELFDGAELITGRARVSSHFKINAGRLCSKCVQMLLEALEDALKRGILGTP
jgi:hypothetical protein